MTERRRVLVVDDDESIRETVEMALSDEGHEVVTAPDGAVALALLRRVRPDVILLDMRMPVMDGWEFIRRYRELPDGTAPVIVLTATHDVQQRAAEVGADGYLAKPFELDALLQLIQTHAP